MANMKIYKMIGLDIDKKHIISFVGAGGKSTSMDSMAKEFKMEGKKVLVTTTTVLFQPQHRDSDMFILGKLPQEYNPLKGSITLLGKSMDNDKIRGITTEYLKDIQKNEIFDIILVEADGARMKPLKAPANHEPVVPSFSTITIGIIGLDSIGIPLDKDHVHRPEILSSILNVELPHIIDENDILNLVEHKEGIFKGSCGKQIIFLNKASDDDRIDSGSKIRGRLLDKGCKDVYVIDVKSKKMY